ncbi:GNAT family N-acetyltransferase [Cognatilysobacter lacus]|uniref:N-acetyltransferase n=1 Tax=Cognatilysobacter lacus TaxID=1643323 RepID=A0A5D8YZ43_9GAMM|nr:GNAT family N-acetyltransferase [Lysobacter lacus]TZF87697.1 N-acetyltransferase [Lysobacter lacus]
MHVEHQTDSHRFTTRVDGTMAEVDYRISDGVLEITHTGVPEAIGGRGIGGDLVRAAFEFARSEGLKVRPLCSYAEAWSRRHAEYADLLA